ncbi:MAG TPA: hypothetical protein VF599_17450, partial [Pyrinomonadaceae bacterium]
MKLELESTAATTMQSPFVANDLSLNGFDAAKINEMLKAGIDAAKQGNRAEARMLLLRVAESQPENETAWLWLASISEYPEELLVFLNNVLNINPHNERALEWSKATKSLLAKTFVQRGINATRENQKDFASQCFHQALAHDDRNEMAWLWLASVADSPEEKTAHLEKVLSLNPENETAQASLRAIRQQASHALLKKANVAAISGEHEAARAMLDELMNLSPEMEEAWILKAYLSEAHEEKIACFEKVLALNPENETAHAGIDSLNAIRQRELERQAQKAELERLQAAAAAQAVETQPAAAAAVQEVPELFFDLNSAARNHSAREEYPDFNYTEDAEDDIHKTSTADKSESSFLQDGPTQELEAEFVQNLEVQSAFAHEFEAQPEGDENGRQIQEFFSAENSENLCESQFSEPSAETEFEEFAQETGQDIQVTEPIFESQTDKNNDYESKDFEIMTKEDSHIQENASQVEENSQAKDEEISQPAYIAEEFFEPVVKETFAENESPAASDFETADEIEEICVDENETLDNYFQ